jgi:hypothetical protein
LGYALPSSRIRRYFLILIDALFSSCLPRNNLLGGKWEIRMARHLADIRVVETRTMTRTGKAHAIIDCHRMIGDDEFNGRLGGICNLPDAFCPYCAKYILQAL